MNTNITNDLATEYSSDSDLFKKSVRERKEKEITELAELARKLREHFPPCYRIPRFFRLHSGAPIVIWTWQQ